MDKLEEDAINLLTPAATAILTLLLPGVNTMVLALLINGIKTGAIDQAAILAFLAEHGIQVYTTDQPGDVTPIYPQDRNSGIP